MMNSSYESDVVERCRRVNQLNKVQVSGLIYDVTSYSSAESYLSRRLDHLNIDDVITDGEQFRYNFNDLSITDEKMREKCLSTELRDALNLPSPHRADSMEIRDTSALTSPVRCDLQESHQCRLQNTVSSRRPTTHDQECQTQKSAVRTAKLRKKLRRRIQLALCALGWVACCPCWTIGFSLRDRSYYVSSSSSSSRRQQTSLASSSSQGSSRSEDEDDQHHKMSLSREQSCQSESGHCVSCSEDFELGVHRVANNCDCLPHQRHRQQQLLLHQLRPSSANASNADYMRRRTASSLESSADSLASLADPCWPFDDLFT